MMILPYNLIELYKKGWLGVQLRAKQAAIVRDENGKELFKIEPYYAYPVVYLSLEKSAAVMRIDEENAVVFRLDDEDELLEFIDIHSEELN